MAANTSPIFGANAKTQGTQFANADGTTAKTIYTAGANGSRILSVNAVTTDTAVNDVALSVQVGGSGTSYPIGAVAVAAGSGNNANPPTASVELLGTQIAGLLADGSLQLGAGDTLQAAVLAAVTTATTLTLFVQASDF